MPPNNASHLAETDRRIARLEDHTAEVREDLAALKESTEHVRDGLGDLKDALERLAEAVAESRVQAAGTFGEIKVALEGLRGAGNALQPRLEALEASKGEMVALVKAWGTKGLVAVLGLVLMKLGAGPALDWAKVLLGLQ